jgi:uncharacterized protein YidB (DUF937 family)
MGLFDVLAKQAIGSMLGGSSSTPRGELLSALLNEAGGLSGLMGKFEQAGLTDTFSSWVEIGENKPIRPDQLQQILGSDAVAGLATKIGLDAKTVLPLLSQFLPQIIDKLTPNGALEETHPSGDQLQHVLTSVLKGGLGGFFSRVA